MYRERERERITAAEAGERSGDFGAGGEVEVSGEVSEYESEDNRSECPAPKRPWLILLLVRRLALSFLHFHSQIGAKDFGPEKRIDLRAVRVWYQRDIERERRRGF